MPRDHPDWKSSAARYTREVPEVRRRQLIEAATRCIEKGGIQAFTIDRICREAGVSRGLINYYFASKDDLLVAVYQAVLYGPMIHYLTKVEAMPQDASTLDRLRVLVETSFQPDSFRREDFLIWLALWGEAATNPRLQVVHREHYDTYKRHLADELSDVAEERKLEVDAPKLARSFMALLNGLWLECCLDERVLCPKDAKEACWDLIESKLGPLR